MRRIPMAVTTPCSVSNDLDVANVENRGFTGGFDAFSAAICRYVPPDL